MKRLLTFLVLSPLVQSSCSNDNPANRSATSSTPNAHLADKEPAEKCYRVSKNGVWQREDSFCIAEKEDGNATLSFGGGIGNTVKFLTFKGKVGMNRETGRRTYAPAADLSENSLMNDFAIAIDKPEEGKSKVTFSGITFYIEKR